MTRTVEIAGAGFAGLSAAAALAQRGWRVRVHEMAPELRSIGSGIYVFAFAQEVLRRIEAFDCFSARAFAPTARHIYVDGKLRSTTEPVGQYRTTTRADLHHAIQDAAIRAGVEIRTGSRAVGSEEKGVLLLEDGTRLEADLVIAADGVRSGISRSLDISTSRVQHNDGVIRVLLDRSGLRDPKWDAIFDYFDYRGERPLRVLYSPCGPDRFYFCLMAPAADRQASSVPVNMELWARRFPDIDSALRRIGDAGRHDRYTTTTLSQWSRGRVAIVGDAAHAMPSSLGQGAGVSILNAVALAEAVADAVNLEQALGRWEATMRPVVEDWQRRAEDVAMQRSLGAAVVHPGGELPGESPEAIPNPGLLGIRSEISP